MLKLLKKKKEEKNSSSLSNLSSRTHQRTNKARQNTRIGKENVRHAQAMKDEKFERENIKEQNLELFRRIFFWSASIAIGIGFIILISYTFLKLTDYVLTHPYFEIQNVEVSGTEQFTNEEIIQLSGLEESTNFFGLDENAIKARMLQNTWVESVEITKDFPNTVLLQVSERVPYFWILHEEQLFYIDSEGQIISPVQSKNFVSLPILDLGVSPEEALLVLPEFTKALDARVDMLPFKLNDIVWIRLSASNGIEMYWEDEEILLSFDISNIKDNLDKMIFALQDLKKRNEIQKIAEIHAGNGQVWFVYN